MDRDVLTEEALAKRWGIEVATLTKWRREGRVPKWFRPGRSARGLVCYRMSDILDWEQKTEEYNG